MFQDCTALTQAPALPATSLATYCYADMFKGCSSLNSINVNISAWNPTDATKYWVTNVSSSGTFTCPEVLPQSFGHDRIPDGWTVETK
jgi:surface protein